MVDSATDWGMIIVAKSWLYPENVLFEKLRFFCPEGMIGKGAGGKWKVFPDATSWRVVRQSKVE